MHKRLKEYCVKANAQGTVERLAFTRYCNHRYVMVYGIKGGGRWRGVYCAMVVQ